ncbi:hypothetical protein MMC09_003200 [Bachmanniomyces sp. S44760]|nr:hypothetical protein [Bachmanniomyces sp. S44760]
MFKSRYSPVASTTELTSFQHDTDTLPLKGSDGPALGKPRAKPFLNVIDVLAVVVSIASLIAAICVITPDLAPSWRLGFEGQIIVIGFLLSIMNLCMMRVAPILFLNLEARWGNSRLQNYESILRNTLTLSHTQLLWRAILSFLILLPLALSIAYKRFTNGQSTLSITTRYPGSYGVAPPPMGSYNVLNLSSVYLAINASVPFLAASSNDDIPLPVSLLPKAYGFNTLLIDNTSTALLDIPSPDYISSIQQNISNQESWTLSASVNATVARYNVSSQDHAYDDASWGQLFEEASFMSSYQLFQPGKSICLGMMVDQQRASSGNYSPYCLLDYYPAPQARSLETYEIDDQNSKDFRKSSPMRFDIQRQTCTGTWKVTKSDFQLVEGSCANLPTTYRSLTNTVPFYLDALPSFYHTIADYSPQGSRNSSKWRVPAIVTSVATMYWARSIYSNPYLSKAYRDNPEISYPATNETLSSTRTTLNASRLLYFVLCLQPILTILMFFFLTILYDTPTDSGFGIVAILSGIDRNSLDSLHGSALSGQLSRPVNLNVSVVGGAAAVGESMTTRGQIHYSISRREKQGKDTLKRGVKYE